MRRFGLYNAVKQGKATSEPGAPDQTVVAPQLPQPSEQSAPSSAQVNRTKKRYSAYRTILSRHEEAMCRIPDYVPEQLSEEE